MLFCRLCIAILFVTVHYPRNFRFVLQRNYTKKKRESQIVMVKKAMSYLSEVYLTKVVWEGCGFTPLYSRSKLC